jgi:hypothetical protein
MTAPLTPESEELLKRLLNRDDLYICSDCTAPEGPCVDHIRVLHIVEEALPAIEDAAIARYAEGLSRLRGQLTLMVRGHNAMHQRGGLIDCAICAALATPEAQEADR